MSDPSRARPLRLTLVQTAPVKARVDENLAGVAARVQDAAGSTDLIVFPEASLSGYFLEGGVLESARSVDDVCRGLGASGAEHPDVVLGFYERQGHRLYNSVAHLTPSDGGWRPVHVHRKMFLPTYGVFDEGRFVDAGRAIHAYDTRFGRMGMLVCEEMWHALAPTALALDGAELLVVVSASPARDFRPGQGGLPGNLVHWERIAVASALEHGIFVAVSQLVGSEGGKVFPGGSIAVAPDGRVLARGELHAEGSADATLDPRDLVRARFESPLLGDLERMLPHVLASMRVGRGVRVRTAGDDGDVTLGGNGRERSLAADLERSLDLDLDAVERVLVRFLREELSRRGFDNVVVGASGGVDSSLAIVLAARALGADKVYAFRLPYRTSSPDSLEHAQLVIDRTGVHGRTIDITDAVDAYVAAHEPDISPLRRGNVMARTRAIVLFDQSAALGALPLGTGNKSERLLGYFTWHADDSPPLNPLGDLFKTQVWALARHLGVPGEIVDKPASADLVRGVHDEDELGIAYHRADPILYWLLRGYLPADLVAHGFDEAEVDIVWKRLQGTHWKRELPTVAVLSSSAIGEFYLRPVDY